MDHGINYIKIRTALALNPTFDLTSNGFSSEFNGKLIDYEEQFRNQIIIPINESVGLHNWAILFIQVPMLPPTFLCDIYVDDKSYYTTIMNIIKDKIRDVEFEFFYKGTVSNYIRK